MPVFTLADLEKQLGDIAVRARDLTPVMRVGGIMYLSETQSRFDRATGPTGVPWMPLRFGRPQGGTKPLSNTGLLRQSFTFTNTAFSFAVGTNAVQASLMHAGGTVRPVRAKALTIPLTKEAVYAGRAGNMDGLFFYRQKKTGNTFLARREQGRGKNPRLRLHWLLTDKAVVPARPIVGVSDEFLSKYLPILADYLRTGRL